MHPFLQNKFIKFAGIGLLILVVLYIIIVGITSFLATSTGLSSNDFSYSIPRGGIGGGTNGMSAPALDGYTMESESSYYMPTPAPSEYTADLEKYETTAYSVTARTKQFDEVCDMLTSLKSDTQVHFKSLNESTNNCRATFFVDENKASEVLNNLTAFSGVEYTRNTVSVTRHRQQIQSQTDILKQQLASVQRSLTAAETQFDEIADFARQNKDAATLSQAINQKLNNINNLTQQKINLTSQLNRLYQQAADLNERMDVVQFDVNINRSNPIYVGKYEREWEAAWENLKDTYNQTLINLSAFFGTFLLIVLQGIIYLLVLIVVLRGSLEVH